MTLNGVEYYYLRNGKNDIIGLMDKTGTQVVSYTYDSWGKLISIDGTLKSTVRVNASASLVAKHDPIHFKELEGKIDFESGLRKIFRIWDGN